MSSNFHVLCLTNSTLNQQNLSVSWALVDVLYYKLELFKMLLLERAMPLYQLPPSTFTHSCWNPSLLGSFWFWVINPCQTPFRVPGWHSINIFILTYYNLHSCTFHCSHDIICLVFPALVTTPCVQHFHVSDHHYLMVTIKFRVLVPIITCPVF